MSRELPIPDPVVAEVHEARRKLLASCGGDTELLLRGVSEREAASGRRLIYGAGRPIRPETPSDNSEPSGS